MFFLLLIIIFLLFRLPSLFEPYWYGDEAVYQVIGTALKQGRLLYSGIWDNKPPPLYLLYALFNGDQFSIRVLSLLLGIFCIFIFYKISQRFFSKSAPQFISTLIFTVFLSLPLFEANIANTEIFMLPLILSAVYLIFQQKNPLSLLFTGALLSLAVLFKQVAIFELIGFSIYLIAQKGWHRILNNFPKQFVILVSKAHPESSSDAGHASMTKSKEAIFYIIGILCPVVLVLIYLIANGIFLEFISSVFSQNTQYVAGNFLGIPFALPILKLLMVSSATYLCLRFRKLFTNSENFILIWFIWSLMDIIFTGMNFPHYLLLFSPVLALFIGYLFEIQKYKLHFGLISILLVLWLNSYFYIFRDIKGYYTNFAGFVMGNIAQPTYWQYFDPRVTRDYKIARYLKNQPEVKNVFIWGDNPQIYKLAGILPPTRYPVVYHLRRNQSTLAETENILLAHPPQIIIILEGMPPYPFSLNGYEYITTIDLARIFHRI